MEARQSLKTPAPESKPSNIAELLGHWATQTPKGRFLSSPERPDLTFGRANRFVKEFGLRLCDCDIGSGDRIAALIPNGPEAALAFIAVASYAAFSPLDPALTEKELGFYLKELQPKAIIVTAETVMKVRPLAERLQCPVWYMTPSSTEPAGLFTLDNTSGRTLCDSEPTSSSEAAPGLVLFTSGTTSGPKSVPLTQGNLVAAAGFTAKAMGLKPGEICLNFMPLYHAHGLTSTVLASLSAGARVVCVPGFDHARMLDWLDSYRPTWMSGVPTMLKALADIAEDSGQSEFMRTLRLVRSASSSLPNVLLKRLKRVFNCPVIEGYGMTEATSMICANPLPPAASKQGSVGPAVDGCKVIILDENGIEIVAGEAGEICIQGPNIFAGYNNAPQENARCFVNGYFRTGDFGYLDEDGFLFIVGRTKEVINRGGSKFSPGEIDAVMVEAPGISDAAAFGLPHPSLGEYVAVAVKPTNDLKPNLASLQAYARQYLAEYKIPSRLFFLDEIPKTRTGKIKRTELAAMFCNDRSAEYVTERSKIHESIQEIWCELLATSPISPYASFFEAGGDSLLLVRLHERLVIAFGIELDATSLFEFSTINDQAKMITAAMSGAAAPYSSEPENQDTARHSNNRERLLARRRASNTEQKEW